MKKFLLIAIMFVFPLLITAQEKEKENEYMPHISGLIRTKAEQNLSTDVMNFYVRNARFGFKGKINSYLSYKAEIDWQDEEEIDMQDAKLMFTPFDDLTFTLGQFKAPFSHDYHRNPADYSFANRNFLTKRLCRGLRDIGAMITYNVPFEPLPIKLELGVFNGNGVNSNEHDRDKSVAARVEFSPEKKWQIGFTTLQGQYEVKDNITYKAKMYSFYYSHWIGNFFVDFEAAQKNLEDSVNTKYEGFYLTLAYDYKIDLKYFFKVTPAIRYEMFNREPEGDKESPRRLSAGLTFHIKENNNSYFRLDYEKYDYRSGIKSGEDKLTLEYVIRI